MILGRFKQKVHYDPEPLHRLNLLELRHISDLNKDIKFREQGECRILRAHIDPDDKTVLILEEIRAEIHELEGILTTKEYFVKEQKLVAAQAKFDARAAVAGKQIVRLRYELLKDEAKVETEYQEQLQKQIGRLSRRQLDLKLVEAQLLHTPASMHAKFVRNRLRLDRLALHQLGQLLEKYQNVKLEDASRALPFGKPEQREEELEKKLEENENLASELKVMRKVAKKTRREGERLDSQIVETTFELQSAQDELAEMEKQSVYLSEMKSFLLEKEQQEAELEEKSATYSSILLKQEENWSDLQEILLDLQEKSGPKSMIVAAQVARDREELQVLLAEIDASKHRLAAIKECKRALVSKNGELRSLISKKKEVPKAKSSAARLQSLRWSLRELSNQQKQQCEKEKQFISNIQLKSDELQAICARVENERLKQESRACERKKLLAAFQELSAEVQTLEKKRNEALDAGRDIREKLELVLKETMAVDRNCERLKRECQERAFEALQVRRHLEQIIPQA